mmetsp:Transcript_99069/g.317792  ORF Transcript_99069/g.317792 Transcript_99069/m.317792 type:complete len:328 (-) Transcript_99069:15-998(-)
MGVLLPLSSIPNIEDSGGLPNVMLQSCGHALAPLATDASVGSEGVGEVVGDVHAALLECLLRRQKIRIRGSPHGQGPRVHFHIEPVDQGGRVGLSQARQQIPLGALDVHLHHDPISRDGLLFQQPVQVHELHVDLLHAALLHVGVRAGEAGAPKVVLDTGGVQVEARGALAVVGRRRREHVHVAGEARGQLPQWLHEAGVCLDEVGLPLAARAVGNRAVVIGEEGVEGIAVGSAQIDEDAPRDDARGRRPLGIVRLALAGCRGLRLRGLDHGVRRVGRVGYQELVRRRLHGHGHLAKRQHGEDALDRSHGATTRTTTRRRGSGVNLR